MCKTFRTDYLRSTIIRTLIVAFSCLLFAIIATIAICDQPDGKWVALGFGCVIAVTLLPIAITGANLSAIRTKDEAFIKLLASQATDAQRDVLMKMRKEYEVLYARKENSGNATCTTIIAVVLCCAWVWICVGIGFAFTPKLELLFRETAKGVTSANAVQQVTLGVVWARVAVFLAIFGVSVFTPIGLFRCLQKHFTDNA